MERRHQVFISSTFKDLVEARREVIQALLELDCLPAGMEMFPASSQSAIELIKSVIDQSDYYIVVVGGRYGSTNSDGISYTEIEYDYAVSTGMPVLGFLHGDPDSIPVGQSEINADARIKLDTFRSKVEKLHCKYWTSAEQLGGVVSRSIIQERKINPRDGWVRGAAYMDALEAQTVISELEKENRLLTEQIEAAATGPLADTEDLQQGQDVVRCQIVTHKSGFRERQVHEFEATWDELIKQVGPLMFDESAESSIQNSIGMFGRNRVEEIKQDRQGLTYRDTSTATDETLHQVIVQLTALGVIKKSIRNRGVKDKSTYWTLTEYGNQVVMSLVALRRSDG